MSGELKLGMDVSGVLSGLDKISKEFGKAGINSDKFVMGVKTLTNELTRLTKNPPKFKFEGSFANIGDAVKAAKAQVNDFRISLVSVYQDIEAKNTELRKSFEAAFSGKWKNVPSKAFVPPSFGDKITGKGSGKLDSKSSVKVSAAYSQVTDYVDQMMTKAVESVAKANNLANSKVNKWKQHGAIQQARSFAYGNVPLNTDAGKALLKQNSGIAISDLSGQIRNMKKRILSGESTVAIEKDMQIAVSTFKEKIRKMAAGLNIDDAAVKSVIKIGDSSTSNIKALIEKRRNSALYGPKTSTDTSFVGKSISESISEAVKKSYANGAAGLKVHESLDHWMKNFSKELESSMGKGLLTRAEAVNKKESLSYWLNDFSKEFQKEKLANYKYAPTTQKPGPYPYITDRNTSGSRILIKRNNLGLGGFSDSVVSAMEKSLESTGAGKFVGDIYKNLNSNFSSANLNGTGVSNLITNLQNLQSVFAGFKDKGITSGLLDSIKRLQEASGRTLPSAPTLHNAKLAGNIEQLAVKSPADFNASKNNALSAIDLINRNVGTYAKNLGKNSELSAYEELKGASSDIFLDLAQKVYELKDRIKNNKDVTAIGSDMNDALFSFRNKIQETAKQIGITDTAKASPVSKVLGIGNKMSSNVLEYVARRNEGTGHATDWLRSNSQEAFGELSQRVRELKEKVNQDFSTAEIKTEMESAFNAYKQRILETASALRIQDTQKSQPIANMLHMGEQAMSGIQGKVSRREQTRDTFANNHGTESVLRDPALLSLSPQFNNLAEKIRSAKERLLNGGKVEKIEKEVNNFLDAFTKNVHKIAESAGITDTNAINKFINLGTQGASNVQKIIDRRKSAYESPDFVNKVSNTDNTFKESISYKFGSLLENLSKLPLINRSKVGDYLHTAGGSVNDYANSMKNHRVADLLRTSPAPAASQNSDRTAEITVEANEITVTADGSNTQTLTGTLDSSKTVTDFLENTLSGRDFLNNSTIQDSLNEETQNRNPFRLEGVGGRMQDKLDQLYKQKAEIESSIQSQKTEINDANKNFISDIFKQGFVQSLSDLRMKKDSSKHLIDAYKHQLKDVAQSIKRVEDDLSSIIKVNPAAPDNDAPNDDIVQPDYASQRYAFGGWKPESAKPYVWKPFVANQQDLGYYAKYGPTTNRNTNALFGLSEGLFDDLDAGIKSIEAELTPTADTDSLKRSLDEYINTFKERVKLLAEANNVASDYALDFVYGEGDKKTSGAYQKLADIKAQQDSSFLGYKSVGELKNIGAVQSMPGASVTSEMESLTKFINSTAQALDRYRTLLAENSREENGKVLNPAELESSRALYSGMRDLGMILPGTLLNSKALPNSINEIRESVFNEAKATGVNDKKQDYVPKSADKDTATSLSEMKSRIDAALKDPAVPDDLKQELIQAANRLEEAVSRGLREGFNSSGRYYGSHGTRGTASASGGGYSSIRDPELQERKQRTRESKARSYAKASTAALMNSEYRNRNEGFDRALKSARALGSAGGGINTGLGGSITSNLMGSRMGFLNDISLSMMQSMSNGYMAFNPIWAMKQAAVASHRNKVANKLIRHNAFGNGKGVGGMDEILATDAIFKEEAFTKNLKGLEGFKRFVNKINEELEDTGKSFTEDEMIKRLQTGKQSREQLMSYLSGEERNNLRAGLKGKERRRVLRNVRRSDADMTRMSTGLMNDPRLAGKLATAAGIMMPIMAVSKLTKTLVGLGKASLKAFEDIEKLRVQMDVIFSSKAESTEMFSNISRYATKSPFGVEQLTQQAVLLRQSGVYTSELMDTIKRIGDLSSGNAEKMKTISDVYARVTSSMTVTARDLRQLSNAGVASYRALSEATGIDQSQIRSRLQAGKISSADFQKMVRNLTDEGGMFYGATERGASTLAARRQNLSDRFTLAKAEVGDFLSRFGGLDKTDSFLGKIINLLERINSNIEKETKRANENLEMQAADKAFNDYKEKQRLYEEANNNLKNGIYENKGEQKKLVAGRKLAMDEALEKYRSLEDSEESILADRWQKANEVLKGLRENKFDGKDVVKGHVEVAGSADGYNPLATHLEKIDGYSEDFWNDFIDGFMDGYDGSGIYKWVQKKMGDIGGIGGEDLLAEFITGTDKKGKYVTETENLFNYFLDFFSGFYAGIANEINKGGTAANDALDGIIKLSDRKIEDVEDINKKMNELTASQSRMSTARSDWNQNSSVAQMMLKDANAAREENLKQKILYYEDERGIYDKDTGTYNLGKLNLNEFVEAEDLITADAEKMELNYRSLWDDATGELKEGAAETLQVLTGNLQEVYDSIQASGGQDMLGFENLMVFQDLMDSLYKSAKGVDKEGINHILMLLNQVDEISGDMAKNPDNEFGKALQTSVQRAKLDKTRDTENKKYINKRKQADLWAHIVSQTTGVSAERVQLSGASTVMGAYTGNFARRDMFSTLGKSLMQNGVSLKELSSVIKDNTKGGRTNWIGASNDIEFMAARKSVETQDALINAYQQQIDTLNNLEMAGVATRDQWDNLGSLSAQLGVGFTLAAQEMADGSYRFTEATIQAAEDMKRELNLKKFVQQIDNVFNKKITELNKNTMETNLKAAFVGNGIDFGKAFNTQDRLAIAEVFVQPIEFLLNENVETFADALNATASDADTKSVLKSLTGMELDSLKKQIEPVKKQGMSIEYSAGTKKNQYLPNNSRQAFIEMQNELFEEYGNKALTVVAARNGNDPTFAMGSNGYFVDSTDFFYKTGNSTYRTAGGVQTLAKLLNSNEEAFEELSQYFDTTKFKTTNGINYKYHIQQLKGKTGVLSEKELTQKLKDMPDEVYKGMVKTLARFVYSDEVEKELLKRANNNKDKLGLSDQDTNLRIDHKMGVTRGSQNTVPYGIMYDHSYDAGVTPGEDYYEDVAVITDEVKQAFNSLVEKFRSGNHNDDDINNILKLTQLIYPSMMDSTKNLVLALEKNTLATNKLAAAQETSTGIDKIKEFNRMTGRLGIGELEKSGEGHRALYDAKAYGDMEEYAPGRMHINTSTQERVLEWLGLPSDTDFKGMLNRYVESFIPQRIKDGNWGDLNAIYEQKRIELEGRLGADTEEYKKSYELLMAEKVQAELAGREFNEQIGAYLANNEKMFERKAAWSKTGRELRWSKEGRAEFKSDMGKLKSYLTPDTQTGEISEENLKNATELLSDYGTSLDDIVEKWVLAGAAEKDAAITLKTIGQNLKDIFENSFTDSYLESTKLIGENMYKIENSLMTQDEAVTSIKKSLASQASALLDQISKEAVVAGLKLIGAGAMEGSAGAGKIAAGLALAAAGGFGSVASGLLSGYASDNAGDKTAEQIARLENLKDNLAKLLQQAKDDADYYERNLRSKQAFQTNESISATKVTKTNDMILSPQGVFSTHPDDYIMAMKDPASLMSSNASPHVSFSIVNNSGTPLSVGSTRESEDENGGLNLQVVVNGMVKQAMMAGEYDGTFAAMQMNQQGAPVSA